MSNHGRGGTGESCVLRRQQGTPRMNEIAREKGKTEEGPGDK